MQAFKAPFGSSEFMFAENLPIYYLQCENENVLKILHVAHKQYIHFVGRLILTANNLTDCSSVNSWI